MGAALTNPSAVTRFLLAGDARFTLVSQATGRRFTYRLREAPERPGTYWLSALTGPDNEANYKYALTVRSSPMGGWQAYATKGSKIAIDAPSVTAFRWWFARLTSSEPERALEQVEFWHEGRCGRCGRLLTVPESIALGLGPECAGRS